ncbi:allophanate hydrolase [Devosia chinhatensis]|uniref:Allophanate hydrolase n=1 Tax=Devosia chinhatensis TaxID=429727 RepID=A0A0F5FGB5_9HYPH|nr:allophanate hydrolase [Devosia chinhatensis]KKB07605.1 allophanate hydrolase [Devosia chinhatensis]
MLLPTDAVRAAYAALARYDDPALFLALKPEVQAIEEAATLEAQGSQGRPLFGMVVAVKDNIDVAGLPTTAACPAFSHIPDRSAEAVSKLEAAGAIVMGKTNLDQFATGLVGVRSPYGVPRNALRADLIPGGSSSGSAVAVAAGIVDAALGTDTAGSGRVPAGLNGIVGLKPSLGLISSIGMVPACRTLDTISVFARDVETARKVTETLAGFDPRDGFSRHLPAPMPCGFPPTLRVGVPMDAQRQFFGDVLSEVAYSRDLETLADRGATLVPIDFEPFHAVARLLYDGPWVAERYATVKPLIENDPDALHPVTRSIIGGARHHDAVSAFEAFYKLADYRAALAPILSAVDVLAVPTVTRFYTLAELEDEPVRYNSNLGAYTNFVNLLDMAAISVPVGKRSDGLPSSLTLIGPAGSDGYLAGLASGLEKGRSAGPVRGCPGHIELAVVGAHLSGLPLNGDLVAAGGVYLRNVQTLPDYRFFALNGTVPPKPGLLRVAPGEGQAIAAEVWALPPDAFGRFVAAIPAPLGIGTLNLDDGTATKGFLVEAEAVKNAEDISHFGGWRAYLGTARTI